MTTPQAPKTPLPKPLQMPKGSTALKGMNTSFETSGNSGNGSFSLDLDLPAGRTDAPSLSLDYDSGQGNGVFGIGFNVSVPSFSVQSSKHIPIYNDEDVYIWSMVGQLVPVSGVGDQKDVLDEDGNTWKVKSYLPRYMGNYSKIEYHISSEGDTSYWKVIDTSNTVYYYGKSALARIANPARPEQIFEWLLESVEDSKGNRMKYSYKAENADGVAKYPWEEHRSIEANRYLKSLAYGNYVDINGQDVFAFEVIFDYGEHELSDLDKPGCDPYQSRKLWECRPDPFSRYTTGFEIRTYRRCRNILVFHGFDQLSAQPCLTKRIKLSYDAEANEAGNLSQLKQIEKIGYALQPDGTYEWLPSTRLDLEFTFLSKKQTGAFKQLDDLNFQIPGLLTADQFSPIDLYGEGISGLLYDQGESALYYPPLGEGNFGLPYSIDFPNYRPSSNEATFQDLEGDGQLDLVVTDNAASGYFSLDHHSRWNSFERFQSSFNGHNTSAVETVDLANDGKQDMMVASDKQLVVYPSLGRLGYQDAIQMPRENEFALANPATPKEMVLFADIFGDGLSHRVRIRNGSVDAWPNLGYGRFGKKVTLGNAPYFGEDFDVSRILVTDIDGSGTSDLVYRHSDRVEIFLNESGNRFSEAIALYLPAIYTQQDQISFADIQGNGNVCLVFTKLLPSAVHYYHEFSAFKSGSSSSDDGSSKPYLLWRISNNQGSTTEIEYASSTKFYLEDKLNGNPWVCKLASPVQVVKKVVQYDATSMTRHTRSFRYRDGYFDTIEREFNGFGYVEVSDTEKFEEFKSSTSNPSFPVKEINDNLYVAPTLVKSWYLTGAFLEGQAILTAYKAAYFNKDTEDFDLPESHIDAKAIAAGGKTLQQAYNALKGHLIREETYGLDSSPLENVPYSVSESNYEVALIQDIDGDQKAVFGVYNQSGITYHYERNAKDPRVEQRFTLKTDPLSGAPTEVVSVFLPRRSGLPSDVLVQPEQQVLRGTYSLTSLYNSPANRKHYLRGITYQEQTFELIGLDLGGAGYFTIDALRKEFDTLKTTVLEYGSPVVPGDKAIRRISWKRIYYWDESQTQVLQLGEVSSRVLLHHSANAVFTPQNIASIFGQSLTDTIMLQYGGYVFDFNSNYWWNEGVRTTYANASTHELFYLPIQTDNPNVVADSSVYHKSEIIYDSPYNHFQTQITSYVDDTVSLVESAFIDYRFLKPFQLVDCNENVSQAIFDPLGSVVVASEFGIETSQLVGAMILHDYQGLKANYQPRRLDSAGNRITMTDVLQHSEYYLQGASAYYYYDFNSWTESRQPLHTVSLERNCFYSAADQQSAPYCEKNIFYSDGFGRLLQHKTLFRSGISLIDDVLVAPDTWQVNGRTIYNNKNNPTEQYLSFFSEKAEYETQQTIVDDGEVDPPAVIRYDPLNRVIKTYSSKGFFTSVEFCPWIERQSDHNDTLLDSFYYQQFFAHYPVTPTTRDKDEKAALEAAAKFYKTPEIKIIDNKGAVILKVENNLGKLNDASFEPVATSNITSVQIRDELVAKKYLDSDGWPTNLFQPCSTGFKLNLDARFDPIIDPLTKFLAQSCLTTLYENDFENRVISLTDPRLHYDNCRTPGDLANARYWYPMSSEKPMLQVGADDGPQQQLTNIFGSTVGIWNANLFNILDRFDGLQRPVDQLTFQSTTGVYPALSSYAMTKRFEYGESQPDPTDRNLNGQLFRAYDQAGITSHLLYNIHGLLQECTVQLTEHFDQQIDWNTIKKVPMLTEVYRSYMIYDAMDRPVMERLPDLSETHNAYHQIGGLSHVEFVSGNKAGAAPEIVVESIDYNCHGQRILVNYGNKTSTKYAYESTTQFLFSIESKRPAKDPSGKPQDPTLQNIQYTYDPQGNLSRKRDQSRDVVFNNNMKVEPLTIYTYDPLYRLIAANGREHPGINAQTYCNNPKVDFMQSKFSPLPSDYTKLEVYNEEYTYDASGNLTHLHHATSAASFGRKMEVEKKSNRLVGVSYDAAGNQLQLSINKPVTLAYNYENRLVSCGIIERPDGSDQLDDTDYYNYNAAGERMRKVTQKSLNGGAVTKQDVTVYFNNYQVRYTYYINAGKANLTTERQTVRVMDEDSCVQLVHFWKIQSSSKTPKQGSTSRRWQLADELGSVALEVDHQAQIINYEEYFPFGGTSIIAGTSEQEVAPKDYRYSGKECDESTGLYYYGDRYYSTWLCRWLRPDPTGAIDGPNLYAFVKGNPVTSVDDEGNMAKSSNKGKAATKVKAQSPKQMKRKSHRVLNAGFLKLGSDLRGLVSKSTKFGPLVVRYGKHSDDGIRAIIVKRVFTDREEFGRKYRTAFDAQDELVSTSSVREFLMGAFGKPVNAQDSLTLTMATLSLSYVRFPTKWSGFANSAAINGSARMQHPTSSGTGIWRSDIVSKDGNPHSEFDRARKQAVYEAMLEKVQSGADFQSVIREAIVVAIAFTLNNFTAPATAADQHPLSTVSSKELIEQVEAREKLKAIAVANGANQQKSSDESRGRRWSDGRAQRGRRDVSPARRK